MQSEGMIEPERNRDMRKVILTKKLNAAQTKPL